MENLFETFHRYFDVVRVDSPDLLDSALQLRYQVYCEENAYEDASQFPDRKEFDQYDHRSVHSLVRHSQSGHFAGVVRLVLPDPQDPEAPFPIYAHFPHGFMREIPGIKKVPRESVAEISRFAVSPEFRRRIAEHGTESGVSGNADYGDGWHHGAYDRRLLPHITLGLFAGIVRMSAEYGITHWFAVMEPTLIRLLTRFGIHFKAVGPMVQYHGTRQPATAKANDVLSGIYRQRREVWQIITESGRIWPLDMPEDNSMSS